MFWSAIVCGVGASLGACVGLFVFCFLFGLFLRPDNTDSRRAAVESLEALRERNRLTVDLLDRLETIAAAIERKPT
jgi:hypothetical protein